MSEITIDAAVRLRLREALVNLLAEIRAEAMLPVKHAEGCDANWDEDCECGGPHRSDREWAVNRLPPHADAILEALDPSGALAAEARTDVV